MKSGKKQGVDLGKIKQEERERAGYTKMMVLEPDWGSRACCARCPGGLGKAVSPEALYVEEIHTSSVSQKGYPKSP